MDNFNINLDTLYNKTDFNIKMLNAYTEEKQARAEKLLNEFFTAKTIKLNEELKNLLEDKKIKFDSLGFFDFMEWSQKIYFDNYLPNALTLKHKQKIDMFIDIIIILNGIENNIKKL